MDRSIPQEVIRRRKRKTVIIAAAVAVALLIGITTLFSFLRSGISAKDIDVAVVDKGEVDISVSASGKVVPLSEQIITSPIASRVVEVYKKSGDKVAVGDLILKLDLDAATSDYGKMNDELSMKQCKLEQQGVTVKSQLSDLRMQLAIADMKLKRMAAELKNEHYLDSIGASTSDKVRQAELNYKVESLLYEQLKQRYSNEQLTSSANIKMSKLEYNIAKKSVVLMGKTMSEAQVRAPRSAVLTWVNNQIGSTVAQGAQLAIVSDLNDFKVEGEIADSYADRVSPGAKVAVRVGNQTLEGSVGNVTPSVKNGIIEFTVMLKESSSTKLRSGLKVDVYVINAISENVPRLANGSYYVGKGEYDLWVINGGVAQKRRVELGESSFDKVEVKRGLHVGDRVIVSDMSKYKNASSLKIRK
ncbi:efflux RND transporter periplasmic adaptor subunit [uncultured Acetobacteroides sp.]|uniref:efflux RND transporter periplasmic adaptor subunit n=1 Tax=uncultured Acetobacteroides sp. TaxID=1760811 RepID=UPI0029F56D49|nr:efflux RND transporter periplasmic adaptor subunit [uncultured Acetobacteroides sp.]